MTVSFLSARCILLDNSKSRRQNIKISAVSVFNLYIISDNIVSFNLLNSPVYSKSVFFVNHIVANLKIREIGNLLAGVFRFSLFLLPCMFGKNVALGNYRKLDPRILKSLKNPSVVRHYLSGTQNPSRIFAIKSCNKIVS